MCERSQPRDSKNSTMCGGSTAVECSNTLTLMFVPPPEFIFTLQ